MRIDLLFFEGGQSADLAVIAFLASVSTVFVHCNLLRRAWFQTFLAVAVVTHLGLIIAFRGMDLDAGEFRLLASVDVLAVIGVAFCIEKLLSLRITGRPPSMVLARPTPTRGASPRDDIAFQYAAGS